MRLVDSALYVRTQLVPTCETVGDHLNASYFNLFWIRLRTVLGHATTLVYKDMEREIGLCVRNDASLVLQYYRLAWMA